MFHFIKIRILFSAILLISLLFVFGCTRYQLIAKNLYQDKKVNIKLLHEEAPGGILVKKDFNHPQNVTPDNFQKELRYLRYMATGVLWQEKVEPIFDEEEIKILALEMSKALEIANSDQMIQFSSKAKKKDSLFFTEKLTDGFFFIYQNKANWVFGNINQSLGQEGEIFRGNPMHKVPSATEVVLKQGQRYYKPIRKKWYQPKVFPNWVIGEVQFNISPSPATNPSPLTTKPSPTPSTKVKKDFENLETDVSERLKKLKSLLKENLITEKDYEKKKQEILKDL